MEDVPQIWLDRTSKAYVRGFASNRDAALAAARRLADTLRPYLATEGRVRLRNRLQPQDARDGRALEAAVWWLHQFFPEYVVIEEATPIN